VAVVGDGIKAFADGKQHASSSKNKDRMIITVAATSRLIFFCIMMTTTWTDLDLVVEKSLEIQLSMMLCLVTKYEMRYSNTCHSTTTMSADDDDDDDDDVCDDGVTIFKKFCRTRFRGFVVVDGSSLPIARLYE
jgi:phage-related protein